MCMYMCYIILLPLNMVKCLMQNQNFKAERLQQPLYTLKAVIEQLAVI